MDTFASLERADIHVAGDARRLRMRRWIMAALVAATIGLLGGWMTYLLAADGLAPSAVPLLALFLLTLPYLVLAFWSAAIGFLIQRLSADPVALVLPAARRARSDRPTTSRVAVVMATRNEAPDEVFRRLGAMETWLDEAEPEAAYEFFVLSDTDDDEIAHAEADAFGAWRGLSPRPERLHYRRRITNEGFKAGNIRDFLHRFGDRFDLMLVLDSDSVMSAPAIRRLVAIMEADLGIGILQPLIVGLPSLSPFARIFQYGMRHGMRVFATGSAWWQGDEGPYWGHNALIRIAPFRAHCQLPQLPRNKRLGGQILSHDQIEAVLMRRAGYEVRVLPLEDGSFEDNPPTLPDFLKRDLRWCQGNLQYVHLLGLPGLRPIGRIQLLFAILMYLGAPFWLAFLALGLGHALTGTAMFAPSADPALGLGLFAVMMTLALGPKLFGALDALIGPDRRRAYGGAGQILKGAGLEGVFSLLSGPVLTLTHTIFMVSLLFGESVEWREQRRAGRTVGWGEAARNLWPHTLLGGAAALALTVAMPAVLPWALPVLLGLVLAVPFACLTTNPALGRWLGGLRLCASPEEIAPPEAFDALGIRPYAGPAVDQTGAGKVVPATTS